MTARAVIALALAITATSCSETGRYAVGEAAFLAPSTIDELQTLSITARCQEGNPIIGPCAERVGVGIYFFGMVAIHAAISWALPSSARVVWQSFTSGMETKTATRNWADGYRPF